MIVKDIKQVMSSATTARLCIAKNRQDALNEKSQQVYTFHLHTNLSKNYSNLEVAYIYPERKDMLEIWAIEEDD